MDLDQFLRASPCGGAVSEGHVGEIARQQGVLRGLASAPGVRRILEVGFNAGHSAALFLAANPRADVVSFDLGRYAYVEAGKAWIDAVHPGRHTLITGDSRATLPAYAAAHPDAAFDLLFVDGGHEYETARADLLACRSLAHPGSVVVMDDTVHTLGWEMVWTAGPTRAWDELVSEGAIVEVAREDFAQGRGHSIGMYAQ